MSGPRPGREGDFALIACSHCRVRAIGIVMRNGATDQKCAFCYKLTRVTVNRGDPEQDWQIRTERA